MTSVCKGDFGIECSTCECICCTKNDDDCKNCIDCSGDASSEAYDKWMMDCTTYGQCENPEENIRIVLGEVD